jgi:hypothetical protein
MEHVRKLGQEKTLDFTKNLNHILDKYRLIADASGYKGELRFQKEGGFTVIFVEIKKD